MKFKVDLVGGGWQKRDDPVYAYVCPSASTKQLYVAVGCSISSVVWDPNMLINLWEIPAVGVSGKSVVVYLLSPQS